MSRDYVTNRIKEALRLNAGSEAKSKRQIMAWLFEDHKFLLELTQPHLTGIVAYALGRVKNEMIMNTQEPDLSDKMNSGLSFPATAPNEKSGLSVPLSPEAKAKNQQGFGEHMLRSVVAGEAAKFGYEGSAPPLPRKAASQEHVDVMHMLAAASQKKIKAFNADEFGKFDDDKKDAERQDVARSPFIQKKSDG